MEIESASVRNAPAPAKERVPIFCPISRSLGMAAHDNAGQRQHDIRVPADPPFIDPAHGTIMLTVDSRGLSERMQYEIREFLKTGNPVVWMTPGEVPEELISNHWRIDDV